MARNMIIRMGVDASDFQKKMAQAGASAESAGKRIKKGLSFSDLGAEVAKIMGWSGSAAGISSINADNVDLARNQLQMLQSYRDRLAGIGFDDYQFGEISERIKALEFDLREYTSSLNEAAEAENEFAQEAEDVGRETRSSESFITKAARALRSIGSSGQQLKSVPGFLRRIGDSAGTSNLSINRMLRSIRNISLASFAVRIANGAFGELQSTVRDYISQNTQLQAQVNGLKASMGQALAPAINLVTGALSYLMPYAVGVSNAIGQLMGLLTGSGWSAAASSAGKTAAATSGAAKAQKEMNRQLMSFDQINKLQSQTDSSSGGGGAGSEVAAIEGKTPAWMERFKASFTELFNSSEFQSANVGGKIGQILQTGIDWVGQEGMDFDWSGVGAKLRENFDSFIGTGWVDSLFYTMGVYLGGFGDMVMGFLGPQWEELKIAYQNEGWQGAVVYILGLTAGLLGNGLSGLFTSILAPMFTGIADFFREHGEYSIAGFFDGCAKWMTNAGRWIKENITDPIVNYVKNLLGIHSPSTVFAGIGENCMDGLGNGFANGIVWVMEKITDLKNRVLGISETLKTAFSFEWRMPSLRLPHLSVSWEPVDNILAQFFGVSAFPRLSVSWFAKGGILDGAQIFGRIGSTLLGGGERGREAVLPLESNTEWMDMIAERVISLLSMENGGDINVTVPVTLDSDVITTVVAKGLRRRARANGGASW